ncbi:MAG: hypothetical protein N3A01_08195 [Bacteroidales bacterium]|nr:hypothetical protein [Bacteroidales bacterium]
MWNFYTNRVTYRRYKWGGDVSDNKAMELLRKLSSKRLTLSNFIK